MFRLALALGMTVDELLDRMSSRELTEWMIYYEMEPFGAARDNLHAGIVAATMANVNRAKGRKPLKPGDFMVRDAQERPAPDPADVVRKFKRYFGQE